MKVILNSNTTKYLTETLISMATLRMTEYQRLQTIFRLLRPARNLVHGNDNLVVNFTLLRSGDTLCLLVEMSL